MKILALSLIVPLAGCVAASSPNSYAPIGFSTYGTTPDGKRVRLWTDYQTLTTTGTIGGQSVRFKS